MPRAGFSGGHRQRRFSEMGFKNADHDPRAGQQISLNPFDLSKVWSYKDFPLIDVGARWNSIRFLLITLRKLSKLLLRLHM